MMMLEHPPTIADLAVPSEEEEEEVKSKNILEHTIDIVFKLCPLHPDWTQKIGSNIKTWMMWNSFANGLRNTW